MYVRSVVIRTYVVLLVRSSALLHLHNKTALNFEVKMKISCASCV